MTWRGICHRCGEEIAPGMLVAYRVRGWEIERTAGGANYIAGKERQPDRIWHAECVKSMLRVGDQLSLTP